jgi:hypothetical protein
MGLIVFSAILTLTVVIANGASSQPVPVFRQDLHLFGYVTKAPEHNGVDYSDINFLTDDLVLVTINNIFYGPVEPLFGDHPLSKLLLVDVSRKRLAKSVEMPVEKYMHSVKATQDGNFVVLNQSGLLLCSSELECGTPLPTRGPLLVSPRGTRILVGGDSWTDPTLLDATSFAELERFPSKSWSHGNVPGDVGLLVAQGDNLYVKSRDQQDQQIPLDRGKCFINDSSVAGFQSLLQEAPLTIARIDGTILFRVPLVSKAYRARIATSVSGSRFCLVEPGHTASGKFVNFLHLDVESVNSPYNFESVKVLSADSGTLLFELRWDPRPYLSLSLPALSPNGRRLAIIRHGFLEVFEIP